MRTKQSFIPFNMLWCIMYFFMPLIFIPISFPEIDKFILCFISLYIYAYAVLKQSYLDWLEWRISEIEEQIKKVK